MSMETSKQGSFDHIASIYWVFTQRCNDTCDHCYNLSGPKGKTISEDECLAIIANLPGSCDRIILSGGEPLTERAKLFTILDALRKQYGKAIQIMLQTNGDLLTPGRLDELLARGVTRIDIASMDRFHKHAGERKDELEALFVSRGMQGDNPNPLIEKDTYLKEMPSYGFWGANEEMWLGGNWARGRAFEKDLWKQDGHHNFCSILSGARGFLGGTELPQEISIQLWRINPCCPGTLHPMGDARTEKVSDVLERVASSPIFKKLNEGDIYGIGESIGIPTEKGRERAVALKNVCLWCDEFFDRYYDMATHTPRASDETSEDRLIELPLYEPPASTLL